MFEYIRRFLRGKDDEKEQDRETKRQNHATAGAAYGATKTAERMQEQTALYYQKPEIYTGNRSRYDSGYAKKQAKDVLFSQGKPVVDPYTGNELVLRKQEAKLQYGENWQDHLAESDHIQPLEKIHRTTKDNPWLTTDDIKEAANSDANINVTSRKFNNAKRSRTNREFVEDEAYLTEKGVHLTKDGKQKAIQDEENAKASIEKQLTHKARENILRTGHEAGAATAKTACITALTISGIHNIVAVVRGEKDAGDAVTDTLKVGGTAAVTGYIGGAGITVLGQSLSKSSSGFIQSLTKSNVPGQVITAVMTFGDTLQRYGKGEISTRQCMIEMGGGGMQLASMPYAMAAGQALIPIPVVGAAVGAAIGSMMMSSYYDSLVGVLQRREIEHRERQRIIAECHAAAEQARSYQKELQGYLDAYFQEYRDCFHDALSMIHLSMQTGNANGMIAGANQITQKLGGTVQYETVEEFQTFLNHDDKFVL